MLALGFKMLLRKHETAFSIVAIALLVAILASTNSIINYIDLQAQTLGRFVSSGATYIILSRNSTSIIDSQVGMDLTHILGNLSYIRYVLPQRMLTANLTIGSISHKIQVRSVDNASSFLKARRAYINGTAAKNWKEANLGEIIARAFHISIGEEVGLDISDRHIKLRVVGIFRSQTQSDAELIVPMETANMLSRNNGTLSLVEFSLKEGVNSKEAFNQIMKLLPENVKLVQAQQLPKFLRQMNMQTLTFLNVWSLAVYVAIAAASYVIATRLVTESSYELAMLRALGAKKLIPFTLILTYTTTVALLGSILGIALGTAGAQTVSTILGWIKPSVEIAPFPEAEQALQTLLLTLASSILGCIYPAVKSTHARYVEQPL